MTVPEMAFFELSERIKRLATNHSQRMQYSLAVKDRQMNGALWAFALSLFSLLTTALSAQPIPAADEPERWIGEIRRLDVAVVANPTSTSGNQHLVDFLLSQDIRVQKVFAPEHGFRGDHAAGEHVSSDRDAKTGLPLVSLYGRHKKPSAEDLAGIDVVIFDIQDVGVRFYTYISTMTYVMEACAENNVRLIILDRPNPNGHLVDGPILEQEFSSFVGLHPVPIAHGMTVGEYAHMVNGEGWLKGGVKCTLTVYPCSDYTHDTPYELPIAPSPNLPNAASIALYPSLCWFEGTPVSIGRGTEHPFQLIGAPWFPEMAFAFTPVSVSAAPHPKFENELCHGVLVSDFALDFLRKKPQLYLFWLIEAHRLYDGSEGDFFQPFFDMLAGTDQLREQIEAGWSEEQIRESWEPGLENFNRIRSKYLLYN